MLMLFAFFSKPLLHFLFSRALRNEKAVLLERKEIRLAELEKQAFSVSNGVVVVSLQTHCFAIHRERKLGERGGC